MTTRAFFLTLTTVVSIAIASLARADERDLLNVRDSADQPVKIIFDTDIGGDIDDAFALALLHVFANRGVCELLGVTITNNDVAAANYVAAFNANYGRPEIPVGYSSDCPDQDDRYPTSITTKTDANGKLLYPIPEGFEPQDAVLLLRKLLANAKDGEIVIAQVGSSYNLAKFLESGPDDISLLSGKELARRKVRLVSVMGGAFVIDKTAEAYREHKEWNIKCNIPAAQKFVQEWPTDIVFSGYEVGDRIRMQPINLKRDYKGRARIARDSFEFWTKVNTNEGFNHRRPTWDLTSVLFVLRPEEGRNYFALSEPGDVQFDDEGKTIFTPNPNGRRRCFLTDEISRARVEEAFVNLCSEP
ncbi:MAG: nucleoside hydrolase [Thermoguttaceae bacterium]|nr:nucleoside hydrolase [Thermoguttaceae bacterium]